MNTLDFSEKSAASRNVDVLVTKSLLELGVPVHSSGYEHLRCAILLTYEEPEITEMITKTLFPKVRRLCNSCSVAGVERSCRHAIRYAHSRYEQDFRYYFGKDYHNRQPTCSEFISYIAHKIRSEF